MGVMVVGSSGLVVGMVEKWEWENRKSYKKTIYLDSWFGYGMLNDSSLNIKIRRIDSRISVAWGVVAVTRIAVTRITVTRVAVTRVAVKE